jgi:hypothetical protein
MAYAVSETCRICVDLQSLTLSRPASTMQADIPPRIRIPQP